MKLKRKSQRWLRVLSFGYAAFFGLTLWAAYTNRLPTAILKQIPDYDKLGHIVLYGIATYLGHSVFKKSQVYCLGVAFPIFPSLFAILTLVEEGIQAFSPYRTLDAVDLICSGVGIILGYCLAHPSPKNGSRR